MPFPAAANSAASRTNSGAHGVPPCCYLYPADQHMHKVDPFAGADREATVALYVDEGYDRGTAEAIVTASEADCDLYHVGSDSARISFGSGGGGLGSPTEEGLFAGGLPEGGAAAWAVAVDLPPKEEEDSSSPSSSAAAGAAPRVQATLLVVLPQRSEAAAWFRRRPVPSDGDGGGGNGGASGGGRSGAAAARHALAQDLGKCPGLNADVAERIRAVLLAS